MRGTVESLILGCVCLLATAAAQSPPTKKYGFCMAQGVMVQGVQSKPYLSVTFETSWPVMVSLESRYLDFIKSKYGVAASRPYCYTYATLADAQRYRPEIVRDEAAWSAVEWTPAATTTPPASTIPKPPPVAPAPTPSASPARAPSQPKGSPIPATIFVICRSEFNTDPKRFYNPPVDGRSAGYPEWSASYQAYLEKTYKFKPTNLSCSKYPNRSAAQADYDTWVSNARASPTFNGLASPIIITDWKY